MTTSMDFEQHRHGEKKQHSCFMRTLIVFNIFFVIAIALSIAIIYRFGSLIKEYKETSICNTPGCVEAAANVLKFMDSSVDPCSDFYDFACGKFIAETTLSDEKVSIDTFSLAKDTMQSELLRLIGSPVGTNETRSFVLAKSLYDSCMNRTRIEEVALQPVINIHSSLGGWPCVVGDDWNENSTWNWIESNKLILDAGFGHSYLFVISIDTDMRNSSRRRIVFDEPSLGLTRELLLRGLNDSVVQAYYSYMVDMAVMFGADRDKAKEDMSDVLSFEMSLANITLPMEQRRNSSELYNPLTLKETQSKFPYINWVEYINELLPSNISVYENETIIFNSLSYFADFGELLEITSNRTIANYLCWRITEYSAYYLNADVRKRQLAYSTVTIGKKELSVRWKECMSLTNNKLSTAVGAMYVRKYFKPHAKKIARIMVNQIREEFREVLLKNNWMDPITKIAAGEKLHAITTHIGYPDELLDDKKLDDYHKDLQIEPHNYFMSILNINKFYMNYEFNQLRKPVNKTDWMAHSSPTFINAYYSFEENSIELPAGILQGIFFDANRPSYMNFGGIGFIIGHELTHGFDDEGRQYDKNGDLLNWWGNSTEIHFLERAQCIIDQYGNYTEPKTNLSINGINTQGENIADNGGLKYAYNAYNRWIEKNGVEPRMPGLQKYTPKQMFWISSAQVWCSKDRIEYMRLRLMNGVHALDRWRVLGSMQNNKQFSEDFKCSIGSRMNPVKKCTVW